MPVREDAVLAQALETLELDTEIPPELYRAVAEALAWAYRLTGRAAAADRLGPEARAATHPPHTQAAARSARGRHLDLEVELDSDPEVMRYLDGRARTPDEVAESHARRMAHGRRVPGLGYWMAFRPRRKSRELRRD